MITTPMSWKVTYFDKKTEKQVLAFPKGIRADFFHIVTLIQEFGPALGRPHTAPLGKGLFEIRAKGREGIARSIFCTVKGREIVILHSFIKKTQKIPAKHMDIALRKKKELDQ